MLVRGAPAIAIAGALSLAVELVTGGWADKNGLTGWADGGPCAAHVRERLAHLVASRPTAVNMREAAERLTALADSAAGAGKSTAEVAEAVIEAAEGMLVEDVASNKALGKHGAEAMLKAAGVAADGSESIGVMTICNTGSLATAGYGTALGAIRALHEKGALRQVYACETRPYNQGGRLTAYEIVADGLPGTLIADSAAASAMAQGKVQAVIVGADRVAANGDTANKIGTYALAVAAAHHNVPFFVASPTTTLDPTTATGADIVIEERDATELTRTRGGEALAPDGICVWNPAFDVTPAGLIAGVVTERGVVARGKGERAIDIKAFVEAQRSESELAAAPKGAPGFRELDAASAIDYVAGIPSAVAVLGGAKGEWRCHEVADSEGDEEAAAGNVNFVYFVSGPSGKVVVKQAMPYVRCVGESWPLSPERASFEAHALQAHGALCPAHVPTVFLHEPAMATIVMEYVKPPCTILRGQLNKGAIFEGLAEHCAEYLATTLFGTSLLAMTTAEHKKALQYWSGNVEMCQLTEKVIFTEPYMVADNNHWTSGLDDLARGLREDATLKAKIGEFKAKFCSSTEALIHGDLHTGSLMAAPGKTVVIDPEFAFYGPMGFDIGALVANLLLAYFAADGLPGDRTEQQAWLLQTVRGVWDGFDRRFRQLWSDAAAKDGAGDLCHKEFVAEGSSTLSSMQAMYMRRLLADSVGFAGCKMIRRIVGIAHVSDMEEIADEAVRAACERRAVGLARRMVCGEVEGIDELLEGAAASRQS